MTHSHKKDHLDPNWHDHKTAPTMFQMYSLRASLLCIHIQSYLLNLKYHPMYVLIETVLHWNSVIRIPYRKLMYMCLKISWHWWAH